MFGFSLKRGFTAVLPILSIFISAKCTKDVCFFIQNAEFYQKDLIETKKCTIIFTRRYFNYSQKGREKMKLEKNTYEAVKIDVTMLGTSDIVTSSTADNFDYVDNGAWDNT